MKPTTMEVPIEVVRELKAIPRSGPGWALGMGIRLLRDAIDKLPDPPKPDVVEECARAFRNAPLVDNYSALRAALRRYRELLGLPADPELDR